MQVGNEFLLSELFTEQRFNSWAVGEIHILDKKIQPNGRRDNFPQNQPYSNLLNHLNIQAQKISKLCREQSIIRNRKKDFNNEKTKVLEKLSILEQPTVPRALISNLKKEIGSSLGVMDKISNSMDLFKEDSSVLRRDFIQLQIKVEKLLKNNIMEDPLTKLPKHKRGIYREVFGLIYECAPNRVVAKSLIDKIISKLITI